MEKKICPECGKEYSSHPALSRKDNKTMICPKCGMMEALDTVRDFYAPGMTDQQSSINSMWHTLLGHGLVRTLH